MLELVGTKLSNLPVYAEASFRFNRHPVTYIRGENRDSHSTEGFTGNGVGKTLLFAAIPNLRYNAPPSAKKKKDKKTLLHKRGAQIVLNFKNFGNKYAVTQTSTKLKIVENGVDMQFHTLAHAEEFLEQIFPITPIEFYSYGYISTLRDYPLQTGTDAERLDIITELFKFDYFSDLRSFFARKMRTIKDDNIRIATLEQRRVSLRRTLRDAKQRSAKIGTPDVGAYEKLDQEIRSLGDRTHQLATKISVLEKVFKVERELSVLREKYRSRTAPAEYMKQLKALRKQFIAYSEYKVEIRSLEKEQVRLTSKLDALPLPKLKKSELGTEHDVITGDLEKGQSVIRALQKQEEAYTEARRVVDRLKKRIDFDVAKVDLERDIEAEIASARATLKLEKLLAHEHDDDDKCPTCFSKIDLRSIGRAVKAARKHIPALEEQLERKEIVVEYNEARAVLKKVVFDPEQLERETAQQTELEARLESIESDLHLLEQRAQLKKQLADLHFPEEVETPDTKLTAQQVDEQIELCQDVLTQLELKSSALSDTELIVSSKEDAQKQLRTARTQLVEMEKLLNAKRVQAADLNDLISSAKSISAEIRLSRKELAEVQKEIEGLTLDEDAKVAIEELYRAYNSKELKLQVAMLACKTLEANLNHYRTLIFAEPFEFSVVPTASGIAILVDRANEDVPTDVRTLSGAESDCFRMLMSMSLLPLIPDSRRMNVIILDEPTSHCDDVSRNIFVERFLPMLAEVVPHIFIITPHKQEICEGAAEFVIIKERGKSRIEEL